MMNSKDKAIIIIICFFAALFSWFYVVTEMNPETTQIISDVTIELRNQSALNDSGLVVSNIDTKSVDVRIRGLRNEVINIENTDINAYVDVVGYNEGSNKVPIEINVPDNVVLIDYNPKQILCEFEAVINKSVDLEIEINGNEAAGYFALQPDSSVNTVIVRGPRSVLNSIEKAFVYIDITEASETITKRIPINIYNDQGIELNLATNPSIAEVTVPIYPIKEVEIDIPIIGEVMEGYEVKNITIEPKTVLIAGREDVINEVEKVRCEPISVEGAQSNIYSPAQFIEGNYYIIENVNPRIEIEIEEIITKDLIFNVDDIEVMNIPEELSLDNIEISNEFILVTIEGLSSIVNEISKEDVKLIADLTEGLEGPNNISIELETDIEINNYEMIPTEVTVNLIVNENPETNEEESQPVQEDIENQ
ncbi:MAG: CdaR family protein [Bacillota bacterium]|nr:CdaR family protein [Bacillota bacterium]